jgi:hypothetical protein
MAMGPRRAEIEKAWDRIAQAFPKTLRPKTQDPKTLRP